MIGEMEVERRGLDGIAVEAVKEGSKVIVE
jgi:hypothetical protein